MLEAEEELVEPDFQDGNKSMMDTECPRCHQSVLARSSRGSFLGRQQMSVSYRPEDDEEKMLINEATPMVVINSTNPVAGQTQVPRAVIDQALSYASSSMTAVTACHRQDGIVRALRDSYRSSHSEEEWPLDPKLGFCLCAAARENDQVFLNALRISGCTLADADYDGRTALHLAVCEQHPGLVEWFPSRP